MAASADTSRDLVKQIRSHEVAIVELNNLPSSRAVYQKNGNIFFRTSAQRATTFEQRQLDATKAKLEKLNSP
ncbi:Lactate utilization protein like [Actinidia chinensis var. chinensis]|uniref:Lactate utilization protein like n=1 Tax=Actinidia chinensis var. chinensis TaxID=1590841 RepID=A0A2R6QKY9_ACTCC|nr:Lactate utilization protein like [Actinidia chinensis var. chinensis]